jgi:DeoR family transcriptional regulator, aga operon transcriptional repressor
MGKKRRQEILQRIQQQGYVSARELAEEYAVDTSTVRRDLDALARLGLVVRNHGGASMPSESAVQDDAQMAAHVPQKQAIAQAVAGIIGDERSLLIDSGSTTLEVARALRGRRGMTVVTNDVRVAAELAGHDDVRLIVIGGEVLPHVYTLISDRAVDLIDGYQVDYAVLAADAIDPRGITNVNSFEAPMKRAMIRAAAQVIVVADSSKFGHSALVRVAGLEDVGMVVTDDGLSEESAAAYPVEVVRVPVPPVARASPDSRLPAQGRARRASELLPTEPQGPPEPRMPAEQRVPPEQRAPSEPRAPSDRRVPPEPRRPAEPRVPPEPRAPSEPRVPSAS